MLMSNNYLLEMVKTYETIYKTTPKRIGRRKVVQPDKASKEQQDRRSFQIRKELERSVNPHKGGTIDIQA